MVELPHIDFDEFAVKLRVIFDSMANSHQAVLVEKEGQLYKVEPAENEEPKNIWSGYDPKRVKEGLRKSAGALTGINREELLADIHAQRGQDSHGRPA